MIIVKLTGGIGNQMFQYAAGRRLAHVRGARLKLDLSWFNNVPATDTSRNYQLSIFRIQEEIASSDEVARFVKKSLFGDCRGLVARSIPMLQRRHIYEKHFHFDARILMLPDNVYLDGYWQCPRYFGDIEHIIRKEFMIKSAPDEANLQIADRISKTESVSLHIRRGDYVSNPETSDYHGVCSLHYYREAVKRITARVKDPYFFIFSDDMDWAKKNLAEFAGTFVDVNGTAKGYEDLRLMSMCKHHVIANSSFSWWGAWLSGQPTVIAPKQWFRNPKIDTGNLIPETWERI